MTIRTCLACVASLLILSASATGQVLLDDQFIDNTVADGSDLLDTNWVTTASALNTLESRADESTTGPDEGQNDAVLRFAPGSGSSPRGFIGAFTPTTLQVGQSLTLSFDYRTSTAPLNNDAAGLRFGFYNSNGTAANGTDLTLDNDDAGYLVTVPTGSNPGGTIAKLYKEAGTDGNPASGTDLTLIGESTNGVPKVADAYVHYVLTITRNSLTQNTVALTVLGEPYDSPVTANFDIATDSTDALFTFDEVLVSTGTQNGPVHRADNFLVSVPEPSLGLLLLLPAAMLVRRRRI